MFGVVNRKFRPVQLRSRHSVRSALEVSTHVEPCVLDTTCKTSCENICAERGQRWHH